MNNIHHPLCGVIPPHILSRVAMEHVSRRNGIHRVVGDSPVTKWRQRA